MERGLFENSDSLGVLAECAQRLGVLDRSVGIVRILAEIFAGDFGVLPPFGIAARRSRLRR